MNCFRDRWSINKVRQSVPFLPSVIDGSRQFTMPIGPACLTCSFVCAVTVEPLSITAANAKGLFHLDSFALPPNVCCGGYTPAAIVSFRFNGSSPRINRDTAASIAMTASRFSSKMCQRHP